MKERNNFSVQLKPVGSNCNLRCKYCYARPYLVKGERMSKDVLEKVIKKLLRYSFYPSISWHGGEPTLAGYDFFRYAMDLIEKYRRPGQKVRNLIQTNGTLISPQLAKLFSKYNFGVSISLDGPEYVNGINRITVNGDNSFNQIIEGIKILREQGVDPSVICTVSKDALPFAKETFDFLVSQGFKRIKYGPVFDSTKDRFSVSNDEWFSYLKTVLYRWFNMSNPDIQVREIDEAITWFSGESLKLCSCDRTCLQWVSVNPKGELYPCEYLRKSYYYGNINNIEFSDIPFSSGYREFSDIYKKNPLKCQRCDFFNVCGNGCPATRVKNGKMSLDGVYAFCDQRKRLFREASNLFEEALEGEEKK
jgi:uncharacterized protein